MAPPTRGRWGPKAFRFEITKTTQRRARAGLARTLREIVTKHYSQQTHDPLSQQQLPPQSQSQTTQSQTVQQQSAERLGATVAAVENHPATARTAREMNLNMTQSPIE